MESFRQKLQQARATFDFYSTGKCECERSRDEISIYTFMNTKLELKKVFDFF